MKTNLMEASLGEDFLIHNLALEAENLEALLAEQAKLINNGLVVRDPSHARKWNIGLESSDGQAEQKKGIAARILEFIRKIVSKVGGYLKNLLLAIFGQVKSNHDYEELQKKNEDLADENKRFEDLVSALKDTNNHLHDTLNEEILRSDEFSDQITSLKTQLARAKTAQKYEEGSHGVTKKLLEILQKDHKELERELEAAGIDASADRLKMMKEIGILQARLDDVEKKFTGGLAAILKKRTGEVGDRVAEKLFERQAAFKDAFYLMNNSSTFRDMFMDAEHRVETAIERLKKYILRSDTKEDASESLFTKENIDLVDETWYRNKYGSFTMSKDFLLKIATNKDSRVLFYRFSATLNNLSKDFSGFKKLQKDFDEVGKVCDDIEKDLKSENDPAKIDHLTKVVGNVRKVLAEVISPAMAHIGRCMTIFLRAREQNHKLTEFGRSLFEASYKGVIADAITEAETMSGVKISQEAIKHLEKVFWNELFGSRNSKTGNNFSGF